MTATMAIPTLRGFLGRLPEATMEEEGYLEAVEVVECHQSPFPRRGQSGDSGRDEPWSLGEEFLAHLEPLLLRPKETACYKIARYLH